jgi:hypothetical protein
MHTNIAEMRTYLWDFVYPSIHFNQTSFKNIEFFNAELSMSEEGLLLITVQQFMLPTLWRAALVNAQLKGLSTAERAVSLGHYVAVHLSVGL